MDYFPLFADLRDRPCLVVGGGQVARRKARLLASAGARVTLVAPKLCEELREAVDAGRYSAILDPFHADHLGDHVIAIAATNDPRCNRAVADAARRAGRLCNVVDSPADCGFIMPAIVDRGHVTVAISSGGRSPTLTRWLKARIERVLPERVGDLAGLAGRWRDAVIKRFDSGTQRQRFWLRVFASPVIEHALAGRTEAAERAMNDALAQPTHGAGGEAYLVGAGPGDAQLLTLRGASLLGQADVVMHDSLVSQSVLELARRDARFINVGKRAGHHSMKQDDISALLVELVTAGQRVCRLKGGDPFIFGRGGEEALALRAAGLDYQIVPGVTAASACGAYAGIPLTHRGVADSVTFVTAHGCQPQKQPDWRALARPGHTIVFYMGIRRQQQIGRGLIDNGLAPTTPVAIVQNATTREQTIRLATLAQLAANAVKDIASPATIIVGEVVRLAPELAWFEPAASAASLLRPARLAYTEHTVQTS